MEFMSYTARFAIRTDRIAPGVVCVAIEGELDMRDYEEVSDALSTAITAPEGPEVVVDLTELEFIDSSGIQALLVAASALKARGGREMIVAGCGPQVRRVLAITHVGRAMPDRDSRRSHSAGESTGGAEMRWAEAGLRSSRR